jgi:hypothetical protein
VNIVPFVGGDAIGKRESTAKTSLTEAAKHDGMRQQLYELEAACAASDLAEVECPLQHVFAPGAYARTIRIPAGSVIVGKIHKHAHLNILAQGSVIVVTEGAGMEELTGPLTMVSPPGTKRALRTLTDVVWTTIHLTAETDLEKIEAEVIAPTFEAYERFALENNMTKHIEVAA